jgi:hypothetical protein
MQLLAPGAASSSGSWRRRQLLAAVPSVVALPELLSHASVWAPVQAVADESETAAAAAGRTHAVATSSVCCRHRHRDRPQQRPRGSSSRLPLHRRFCCCQLPLVYEPSQVVSRHHLLCQRAKSAEGVQEGIKNGKC